MRAIRNGCALLVCLFIPLSALAATDGTLGSTSTGTANISISISPLIQISNVADINLGSWSGSGNLTGNDNVCVYTNFAAGTYKVTATGNGTGGAFTLSNGSNTVAYTVSWNDANGTSGQVAVTSGVPLTGQSGANTASTTCSGGTNANFAVNITSSVLGGAPNGSYTGNLSLVVEPF